LTALGKSRKDAKELSTYLPLPPTRSKEFWTRWKISHIRKLAVSGHETTEPLIPESERSTRVLDRLYLKLQDHPKTSEFAISSSLSSVSTALRLCRDSDLELSAPLYLGDMSFGALSGVPNIAIARAADATGILAGTGEGGLLEEIAECKRITVQWASARFGVDINTLSKGHAVVIKIGQGAKPGIGGHLPGVKVTRPIAETRRIPQGKDAISPAPHHDIYSIEDLGQRILALKEATKKPVFVKVGATNYIPYVASGIARMGASGIIIDGAGAGTGAAPSVVKNNVGIPIELAVSSVDSILRKEGLREGFTVVAAGKVSCPEDAIKLIALGADITSLGTSALLALGCLMVHKCHLGYCPAILTNKITENQAKILSLEQSVTWLTNLVHGWTEEMKLLLRLMGLSDIRQVVGRRDLLIHGGNLNEETKEILGLAGSLGSASEGTTLSSRYSSSPHRTEGGTLWTQARINMLREMAGTIGKSPAEAEISSMGSTSVPFVEPPIRLSDWLVTDGAQVTRPSIDPYREEIEIFVHVPNSKLRLSAPFFFTHLPDSIPAKAKKIFARSAVAMGLILDCCGSDIAGFQQYSERLILDYRDADIKSFLHPDKSVVGAEETKKGNVILPNGVGVARIPGDGRNHNESLFLRVPSSLTALEWIETSFAGLRKDLSGIIVDEDSGDGTQLEVSISRLDNFLKSKKVRSEVALLAESNNLRGADDIFKLLALGADLVGIGRAALIAIGFEEGDKEIIFDSAKSTEHLENFIIALEKEIKLLAGAAGLSSVSSSLVGNTELLRSIDLDPETRKQIGVKPAGGA